MTEGTIGDLVGRNRYDWMKDFDKAIERSPNWKWTTDGDTADNPEYFKYGNFGGYVSGSSALNYGMTMHYATS